MHHAILLLIQHSCMKTLAFSSQIVCKMVRTLGLAIRKDFSSWKNSSSPCLIRQETLHMPRHTCDCQTFTSQDGPKPCPKCHSSKAPEGITETFPYQDFLQPICAEAWWPPPQVLAEDHTLGNVLFGCVCRCATGDRLQLLTVVYFRADLLESVNLFAFRERAFIKMHLWTSQWRSKCFISCPVLNSLPSSSIRRALSFAFCFPGVTSLPVTCRFPSLSLLLTHPWISESTNSLMVIKWDEMIKAETAHLQFPTDLYQKTRQLQAGSCAFSHWYILHMYM